MIRGLVLAGGRSRRFGTDKALAIYCGKSFLSRAVEVLEKLKLQPVIVGRNEDPYFFSGCPALPDLVRDKGPLGGIYTAMSAFPETTFLVLTCDMPALDEKILHRLLDAHARRPALTVYRAREGRHEPFPGIYPHDLFPRISTHLSENRLAMRGFIDGDAGLNAIRYAGLPKALSNINRVPELKALRYNLR